jgi:3-oxoacyl-[acyl-carrier protein] reductase
MRYSEIQVGDKQSLTHLITKEDIEKFVELTGDDNKLHVDEKYAGKTSFKKPVVHGMLGASFISTIIGTKLPGDGALWFSQTLEFLLPVRIGDEITISAEVLKKNDRDNSLELKTEIINQNRQVVTRGIAKVKVIEQQHEQQDVDNKHESESPGVALVIGGTGGIGRAACIQLAKDGFDVIIHYNRNSKLASEIKTLVENKNRKALIVKADITKEEEVKDIVSKSLRVFGKIDVTINCAASIIPNIKFAELRWTDFLTQLEINIKATFTIMKLVIPSMLERGYGKIINIGSLSVDKPNAEWAHYITAKSALTGFTRSLAFELAPKGIRINQVTPGMVDTELISDIPEKVKLLTAAQTPLRRLASTEDIAGVISFLASKNSDFITGENIRVNGGQTMN